MYKSKMYALSLWHIIPKCYRLYSTSLNLPYISSIRNSARLVDIQPSCSDIIFDALKKKSSLFDINQCLVILAFDEISIQFNL